MFEYFKLHLKIIIIIIIKWPRGYEPIFSGRSRGCNTYTSYIKKKKKKKMQFFGLIFYVTPYSVNSVSDFS